MCSALNKIYFVPPESLLLSLQKGSRAKWVRLDCMRQATSDYSVRVTSRPQNATLTVVKNGNQSAAFTTRILHMLLQKGMVYGIPAHYENQSSNLIVPVAYTRFLVLNVPTLNNIAMIYYLIYMLWIFLDTGQPQQPSYSFIS